MARLTDSQLVILSAASQREDRGVELPENVQGKAAGKVIDKLLRAGFLEEVRASSSLPVWRRDDESGAIALRITSAGLAAIDAADEAMPTPGENGGRLASTGSRKQMSVAAQKAARKRHRPGKVKTANSLPDSRPGSKQARVLAMLGRPEGADHCRHHADDPLAAAFGARLFRRCRAQETRPRSSLGEGRR